ncbi:MAG TPA: NYN domain-containing protein [Ktedonobacterales bacterium]
MESEHTQVSPSHAEPGASDTQDAAYTTPGQNGQPEQELPNTEGSQNEATSAGRHRRRRPPRGGARRSRSAAGEQSNEEGDHSEASAETEGLSETPPTSTEPARETQISAETAEASGAVESTAPAGDLWQPEAETSTSPASAETTWGFQRWREQPPTDWNPFLPHTSEAQSAFTLPIESGDVTGGYDTTALSGAAIETPPEVRGEIRASAPTQDVTPEASAAPGAPEQTDETSQETVRAPLSGVEVRPPRRYRFDRPSSTTRETPRPTAQQGIQASEAHAAPTRGAAPATGKGRRAPSSAGKETAIEAPADHALEATIEREMTETPEIEADVVAGEDLARATQAALEEEVAEALESFTAAPEQAPGPRSGRRRRRRPTSPAANAPAATSDATEKAQPPAPLSAPAQSQAPQPYVAPAPQPYQVANGLQQLNQPQSPFAGPEPSSARGFGPVPRGVAMPAERGVRMPRPERTVETGNISANQLALIFTQAIQQQTDRLLMELRRSQGTPSMTVNFPPMPSNERIGVFVDVANLLYSARNMRLAIDFGRLLDFLRGNRRLVRAHAYCPTSPDPRAEQMFLDAVKGLGYRITTKNYKTFSSGAKKADLDLDLCMDIVRLVDSGAVDCISLVSGDSDFLPLLEYCSDHGVRVEVAAFDEATASILRQSCDLFINLSMVEEIRA